MQTYKICSAHSQSLSKTKDNLKESKDEQDSLLSNNSKNQKKENQIWCKHQWQPSGFIRDHMPPITIAQMTKQNFNGIKNFYPVKDNCNLQFYPVTAKWVADFRAAPLTTSIGTVPSIRSLKFMENEYAKRLLKHRSTITVENGTEKKTKDAANLAIPCAKHMHSLLLPLFSTATDSNNISKQEGRKQNSSGIKRDYVIKGEHFTTGTQASLVTYTKSQILNMMLSANTNNEDLSNPNHVKTDQNNMTDYSHSKIESTKANTNPKNYPKTGTKSAVSISSWDYFDDRLPELKASEKPPITRMFVKQIFKSNDSYTSTEPEMVPTLMRNSSGILNYNGNDIPEILTNDSSRLIKTEKFYCCLSELDNTAQIEEIGTGSFICSLHNEVNCRNSVCKKKSSHSGHKYYEPIVDQVNFIKKRIRSLCFTLGDVDHLFSLMEKANENIMNLSNNPKDMILAKNNKLTLEDFYRKVKSGKDETKITLNTIRQLEQLFDAALMKIETCEKIYNQYR